MGKKTHWLSFFRISHLNLIVDNLETVLNKIVKEYKEIEKYESLPYREEYDETLGFIFMAFQSFISGTIADFLNNLEYKRIDAGEKNRILKLDKKFNEQYTIVEIINGLANFFKHKDEGPLSGETAKIISSLKIDINDFPLTSALYILEKKGRVQELKQYVIEWRETLV